MFRSRAGLLKSRPEGGLKVIIWGNVTVYSPRGEYQIIVEFMEPKGIGDLQLAFEQLKKKLKEEGLFEDNFKKPIPLLPLRIGVVTSPTGAAIRDIINVITRRFANIGIFIYPTSVQGEEASGEIVNALEVANRMNFVDVLIVGRGGGSIEDLFCFNDERVARAIFESNIPVISAVGHETDFTIADFVADLRAPTPSAAAELVIGRFDEFVDKINKSSMIMKKNLISMLNYFRVQLDGLIMSSGFSVPDRKVNELVRNLEGLDGKIKTSISNYLHNTIQNHNFSRKLLDAYNPLIRISEEKNKFSVLDKRMKDFAMSSFKNMQRCHHEMDSRLENADPRKILKRGFVIPTFETDGRLVRSVDQVKEKDRLNLKFHDGEILSRVEEVKNG